VRAILWLHSHMKLRTAVLPTHAIEDPQGRARLKAYAVRSHRASDLMFVAGCLLVVATFFAMIGSRPDVQGIRTLLAVIQWIGVAGGVALGAAAWVVHRMSREPIVVELRLMVAHTRPIAATAIEQLRRDAQGLRAWMLSEIPYSPEALEAAKRSRVRCFIYSRGEFVELTPDD
jgi:hypothetical protein